VSAPAPAGSTRRAFIGAAAGAALLAPVATRAAAAEDDVAILSLALDLEHLQAALYTDAARLRTIGPVGAGVCAAIGGVERDHVALLTEALGSRAAPPPAFDLGDARRDEGAFLRTAVAVEELAAGTHLHALPLLASPDHRALLASIHTVDAGHAAWIRLQAGAWPVTAALDDPVPGPEAVGMLLRGGYARPRPGAPPGDPWSRPAPEGPQLLAAFALGPRPPAPAPVAGRADGSGDGPPSRLLMAGGGAVSALLAAGLGLGLAARRRSRNAVTVVGPDEGPTVSQHAPPPRDPGPA
jgi:hypothetical protein